MDWMKPPLVSFCTNVNGFQRNRKAPQKTKEINKWERKKHNHFGFFVFLILVCVGRGDPERNEWRGPMQVCQYWKDKARIRKTGKQPHRLDYNGEVAFCTFEALNPSPPSPLHIHLLSPNFVGITCICRLPGFNSHPNYYSPRLWPVTPHYRTISAQSSASFSLGCHRHREREGGRGGPGNLTSVYVVRLRLLNFFVLILFILFF